MTTSDTGPYKSNFQATNASDQVKGITQTSIQIISFYEKSSTEFKINIGELDTVLKDLVIAQSMLDTKPTVKLLFSFIYTQLSGSKQASSTSASSGSKTFNTEVKLSDDQIKQIFRIYSAIRNIGSENPQRTPDTLSNITLNFTVGVVEVFLTIAYKDSKRG
jgi:hypothetical protein